MGGRADSFKEKVGIANNNAPLHALMLALGIPLPDASPDHQQQSMLDLQTVGLVEDHTIERLFRTRGIRLDRPQDLLYVGRIFREAVEFYDAEIADNEDLGLVHIVQPLRNGLGSDGRSDVPERPPTKEAIFTIFKTAAGQNHKMHIPQACALLRIAYAIDFMERDPTLILLPDVARTLQEIFKDHIIPASTATSFPKYKTGLTGDLPVTLVNFEVRTKTRTRILAKLLQKPANRTIDVLDHIGFRITTHSPLQTLQMIYSLFFDPLKSIFPGTNIRLADTKNLTFDPDALAEVFNDPERATTFVALLSRPVPAEYEDLTIVQTGRGRVANDNPHSGEKYSAIQIVFDLPITTQSGERRFFPVELQILHQDAAITNEMEAPHDGYVAAQMKTVRNRVGGAHSNLLGLDGRSRKRKE